MFCHRVSYMVHIGDCTRVTPLSFTTGRMRHPRLFPSEGDRLFEHIIHLNKELYLNALSMFSNLGGAQS